MRTSWTLNVEEFGKIEKASVRVSPLMIFVGENNSGKSYLMSLLWGIATLGEELFPSEIPTSEAYRKLDEWLLGHVGQASDDVASIVLDSHDLTMFANWFSKILQEGIELLTQRIFNSSINIRTLYINDIDLPWEAKVILTGRLARSEAVKQNYWLQISMPGNEQDRYYVLKTMCFHIILGEFTLGPLLRPLYLPASRTGFMLTYKMLAKKSIQLGFGAAGSAIRDTATLTLPVTEFLSELVSLEIAPSNRYQTVISFLQQEILQGEIRKDDSPVPNYLFKPVEVNEELSMHLTSSLVSEITPIILFLQSQFPLSVMIIEEPEAHLHLEMQKKMAQAIVRLVNLGLPVWITTHSDTMFQQFNNLVKLHNHPNRAELAAKHGYEEADFLGSSLASAYQFKVQDRKTTVESLKATEYGFSAPTFNKSIINLRKETLEFQEFDTDAE